MVLRRVCLCWLLWALVLAPALGLVHGVAHSGWQARAETWRPDAAKLATVAARGSKSQSLLEQLFQGHGAGDCRLYDQHGHGDASVNVPVLVLPAVLPAAFVCRQAGLAMAHWIALFDARGPPFSA